MHGVRREQADQGEDDAGQRQQTRHPGQRDYAGDDGGRRQHDADLECGRGDLVVMILGLGQVALLRYRSEPSPVSGSER
jgi:hypothetical protein